MILYKKTIVVWSDVPGYGEDCLEMLKNSDLPITVYGIDYEEAVDSDKDDTAGELVAEGAFSS